MARKQLVDIDLNNARKVINVPTPVNPGDATSKSYVDGKTGPQTVNYYQSLVGPTDYTYSSSNVFTLPSAAGTILYVAINGQVLQPTEYALTTSTTVTVSPSTYTLVSGDKISIAAESNATFSGAFNQDMEITNSAKGFVVQSPNGTRWRIQVNNAGAITTTVVT